MFFSLPKERFARKPDHPAASYGKHFIALRKTGKSLQSENMHLYGFTGYKKRITGYLYTISIPDEEKKEYGNTRKTIRDELFVRSSCIVKTLCYQK